MILNLQTMRVLFTFLVVTAHLAFIYQTLGVVHVSGALTHVSVDGFIVVSAFLIPYTHALRPRPPLDFLGRRLARLVPFYWFITLLVAGLSLLAPQIFNHPHITVETVLKSLFFIPYEKHPGVVEPIVFVGWTMNYFAFYMVVHAISLQVAGARAWLMTAVVLVGLVLLGWIFKPENVVLSFYSAPRLLSFVAGLLLSQWWLSVRDGIAPSPLPRWLKPACYASVATGLVLITMRDVVFAGMSPRLIGPVLASVVIAAVLILDRVGAVHRGRIRDRLAEASFAIYLTHYFVTQAAVKTVQILQLRDPLVIAPLLVGTYLGVAVLGIIVNQFVEIPLEAFVRGQWSRLSNAGSAASLSR